MISADIKTKTPVRAESPVRPDQRPPAGSVLREGSAKNGVSSIRGFAADVRSLVRSGRLRLLVPMFTYMVAYLICFMLIEHWNRLHYTVIHTAVDDMIPFVPVFVLPYVMWFPYVLGFVLFLALKHRETYHRVCTCLVIGMTVFVAVSVVYPNIHMLRPETMPVDNAFTKMISMLYLADTPTNLTPSIHVFNSLAVMAGAWQWDWRTDAGRVYAAGIRNAWRTAITTIGMLIILSTMFIKQHSFSDVVIAVGLFLFTYILVYRFGFTFLGSRRRRPVLQRSY
ncbi:MAG: serine/threonine protein phosphatase [Eubacteriales bacterium]|nr:serine/threonine protein phosphatase [Eubacteriales bacterium]